jgi:hypothetical protein
MLFQVLCGFEPIFYTTHPNEEPRLPPFLHDKRQPTMDCPNKRKSSKSFTDLLLDFCDIYLLFMPFIPE